MNEEKTQNSQIKGLQSDIIKKSNSPKILMFETEILLSEMYKEKFNQAGFEVKIYDTYKNVVDLVAKEKPDIISCDIVMAKSNIYGDKAIQLLKADKRTKDIPVIFLTNLGEDKEIKKGLSLGAVDYLVKARITPARITEKFKEHLIKTGKFTEKDFKYKEKINTKKKIIKKIFYSLFKIAGVFIICSAIFGLLFAFHSGQLAVNSTSQEIMFGFLSGIVFLLIAKKIKKKIKD